MVQMRRRWWRRKSKKQAVATSRVHNVPDDVLKLILLRLDSPLWLIRSAATCKRWRGVIAGDDEGGAFLRLACSLHPPTIVGHYHYRNGTAEFVPSSPPAPIDWSRFSLNDFLPFTIGASDYEVVDCHGGLVLLGAGYRSWPQRHIVCDPLTRRYQGIDRGPDFSEEAGELTCVYLLDGEDDTGISISNFRLFGSLYGGATHRACVFSTADGGAGWRFLPASDDSVDRDCKAHLAGRIDGSLYLSTIHEGCLIVLDNNSLDFSVVDLPSIVNKRRGNNSRYAITYGDSGSPPKPRIIHVHCDELDVFSRVHGSGEWVLEHSIRQISETIRGLPGYPDDKLFIWKWRVFSMGTDDRFILVSKRPRDRRWLLSLNMETMEMVVVPQSSYDRTWATLAYTLPWPSFIRDVERWY